jgi:outer membrane receptor protein involved in Fe transport
MKGIVAENWGWSCTAFVKDVFNLLATNTTGSMTGGSITSFFNIGTSRVMGVEMTLAKNLSSYWSVQANYTYSVAKGNASDAVDDTNDERYDEDDELIGLYRPDAWADFYLNFDRRHVANAMIFWQSSESHYPRIAGSLLRGVSVGTIISYASGLPYTIYHADGEVPPSPNTERMDATFRVDMRASKTVLFKPVKLTFFAAVENLFDRINPLEVDRSTGQPWSTLILPQYPETNDRVHDPARVDVPRIVRAGLMIEM